MDIFNFSVNKCHTMSKSNDYDKCFSAGMYLLAKHQFTGSEL